MYVKEMDLVKNQNNITLLRRILYMIIATLVLAVSSKIKIPFYPVPMTMQTFVVLFIGIVFGWKMGLATISLYLMEGLVGLPVFAGTPEKGVGIIYFMGPTMGYLIGFLAACFFAGYFSYNKNIILNFIKLLFATSLIYVFGIIWLGNIIGFDKPLFKLGLYPFAVAEIFKIVLLTLVATKIKNLKSYI